MKLPRFLNAVCVTILLCVALSRSGYAQEKVIITGNDTVYYNVQPDIEEYKILENFYKQTNGKRWNRDTKWLKGKTSAEMAKWFGVVVRDGDVSEIHLNRNNLRGKIPKSLYKLVRLQAVSFDGNNLTEDPAPAMTARSTSESLSEATPIGNLPVWALSVEGPKAKVLDWRKSPVTVDDLPNSGISHLGSSGVGINKCGALTFYVLHSGKEATNQLHIYSSDGTRLTKDILLDPLSGLNSAARNIELQVVRVPGEADEWYIIYSLFTGECRPESNSSSVYCPAKVAYARVKFNENGLQIKARDINVTNGSIVYDKTFIQGKAVSRAYTLGTSQYHFLYLAERTGDNYTRIDRFIIDNAGIRFDAQNAAPIHATYWPATIAGSSIELSPDETKLAISNRNVGEFIAEDIIIFDLSQFSSAAYTPSIISVPELIVAGTNQSIREIWTTNSKYFCLKYLKNKLSQIEFSPQGRYLYAVFGGYVDGSSALPYNSYLLQINLFSGLGNGAYEVRMQIQHGIGVGNYAPDPCVGTGGQGSSNHFISEIQSAYQNKLFFTKRNSSTLYAIADPDRPMAHSLEPNDNVNISTATSPNITIANSVKVEFMPENIDGFDYLAEEPPMNSFSLDKTSVVANENVTLTIANTNTVDAYQVSWGDGKVEVVTQTNSTTHVGVKTHRYTAKGQYAVTLTVTNPQKCSSSTDNVVSVIDCAFKDTDMDIHFKQYRCATKFSIRKIDDCYATYHWDFGDGTTSDERAPMHVYGSSGDKTVVATITYNCKICADVLTKTAQVHIDALTTPQSEDRQINVPYDSRGNIISCSASTFSDTWPLDHQETSIENLNSFTSGSEGVWRNEGSFVYNTERKSGVNKTSPDPSSQVDLVNDGTYIMQYFNWPYADLNAVPNWLKVNSMTRYNAYGYELENKDPLNVYSAALYDYGGQLQSAHGVNMRNEEMGFTSFETYGTLIGSSLYDKRPSGNFVFASDPVPALTSVKVLTANAYVATVNAKLANLSDVDAADIIAEGFTDASIPFLLKDHRYLQRVKILCKEVHPTFPDYTILVFERTPFDGLWTGNLQFGHRIIPVVQGVIDSQYAHTGKNSMKITATQTFEQRLFHLDAGKTYHFSGWVSVGNPNVTSPKLADRLGIDIILKDKGNKTIGTTSVTPVGKIIEGWQQVKGSFTCPANDLVVSLRFTPGTAGTAWFDDVRLHPDDGNMKSYVYNLGDLKLQAILDENNFASMFYYDKEGNLYLTKKETEEGVKTITENISFQVGGH
jgi:PKD repeat protein